MACCTSLLSLAAGGAEQLDAVCVPVVWLAENASTLTVRSQVGATAAREAAG